jgi:putative chitinase
MLESQLLALGIDPKWTEALNNAFNKYQINTPKRKACFLGQCMHESGGFKFMRENLNYSARALMATWPSRFPDAETAEKYERQPEKIANKVYGGRMGNTEDGDGWKYIGRGLIQLTGKDNYAAASEALGEDLVSNPQLVEEPRVAALTAGWFWNKRGLNELADQMDIATMTRRINGGNLGIADRQEKINKVLTILSSQPNNQKDEY